MSEKCELCEFECSPTWLTVHISNEHGLTPEEYFRVFFVFKDSCDVCDKPTKFINRTKGYRQMQLSDCVKTMAGLTDL